MPDNSAKIEAIDNAIASGTRSVVVDGQTVTYRSLAEMRSIRKSLVDNDTSGNYTSQQNKRRPFRGINLRGSIGAS